jgi:cytochrome c oxidase subunit IV
MSADAHPQSAWRLTLALLFLLGLTALEVGVVGLPGVDRAVRITALIGLGMTKGAVLLTASMRMGREPLVLRAAVIVPLLFAPGFAVALMLDTAYRVMQR